MAVEIERKFLVKSEAWRKLASRPVLIRQGYLSRDPDRIVRVRLLQSSGYLTVKSRFGKVHQNTLLRSEFEYPIPLDEASFLLDRVCLAPVITKKRYQVVEEDGSNWEIDEFVAPYQDLVIAEIELSRSDDAFALPSWLGAEVTFDYRYSNSNFGTENGLNELGPQFQ